MLPGIGGEWAREFDDRWRISPLVKIPGT